LPNIKKPVAAVQAYVPWKPVARAIAADTKSMQLMLAGGLAILYLFLFRLVAGASRKLRRQADANRELATHDNLTGLPNRTVLVERLDAALTRSARNGREIAVLFCDLDGFKRVNDTGGHAAGDAVLLETARRLNSVLRGDDTVARVGGDEFVIVVEPWHRSSGDVPADLRRRGAQSDRAVAVRVAERVAAAVRQPITVNGVEHVITASIGIAYATLAPGEGTGTASAEEVLHDADAAMYQAKDRGKDRFVVFGQSPQRAGSVSPAGRDHEAAPGLVREL
ncbi:MAG: diguanylate cyclase domain-containing protein, partial [Actinomycetes bacterium]